MGSISSGLLTVAAHFSKMIMGFILLKLIAYYLGAEGLGQLGHFMSLLTMLSVIAGGGIVHGVIKYTAEYKNRPIKLFRFASSAACYTLYFSIFIFIVCAIFSRLLAEFILGRQDFYIYIIALAIAQFGFAFSNLIIGISNGLGHNEIYAKIQIAGSLLAVPFCWLFVYFFEWPGAILGLIFSLFAISIPSLWVAKKSRIIKLLRFTFYNSEYFSLLSRFTLMLMVSVITFPLVEIFIRQKLIIGNGYHEAGIWQAGIRLSSAYTGVFSVFLAFWFMPKISAEKDWHNIINKTIKMLCFIMLIFLFGGLLLYFGRVFFIPILLSSDFNELENIIHFQLIGDFFKVGAYTIGFVGVAKAATKIYIAAEIVQNSIFFLFFVFISWNAFSAKNTMISYALTYAVYFFISLFVLMISYKFNSKSD